MKLRVKTKIKNGAEFEHLMESEQKIFNLFGKKWVLVCTDSEQETGQVETPAQKPLVSIASDHDLESYLQDPYEIESLMTLSGSHVVDNNCLKLKMKRLLKVKVKRSKKQHSINRLNQMAQSNFTWMRHLLTIALTIAN